MRRTTADIWNDLAADDPASYILLGVKGDRFDAAGENDAESIVRDVVDTEGAGAGRSLAVDLGAGVGRVAIPMARHFDRVVAVDAAPRMLERLEERAAEIGVSAIETREARPGWGKGLSADLVYSTLTLQHIAERDVLRALLRDVRQALAPGGVAWLQFDTRPETLPVRVRNHLPDRVLPSSWRRGLRRVRRPASECREWMSQARLVVVAEHDPRSSRHVFLAHAGR
jgi:SAM-dependent methyltransferase